MRRMTGYELMVHLRQSPSTRRIPVMVVTSRAGAKHRDRAIKEGATAFLTKPVQEDQLIAAVEQLIGTEAPRSAAPVAETKNGDHPQKGLRARRGWFHIHEEGS